MATPITIRYAFFENADSPVPCSPLIRVAETKEVVFDPNRLKQDALKIDLSKISNLKKGNGVYLDLASIHALKPEIWYHFGFKSETPPDCWAHAIFMISKDSETMGMARKVGWPGTANANTYSVPLPKDADIVTVENTIESEFGRKETNNL